MKQNKYELLIGGRAQQHASPRPAKEDSGAPLTDIERALARILANALLRELRAEDDAAQAA